MTFDRKAFIGGIGSLTGFDSTATCAPPKIEHDISKRLNTAYERVGSAFKTGIDKLENESKSKK